MPRFSAGCRAPSSTLARPWMAIVSDFSLGGFHLIEAAAFNTDIVADTSMMLCALGGGGVYTASTLTAAKSDPDSSAALAQALFTFGADPSFGLTDAGYRDDIPKVSGGGVTWRFPGRGIHCKEGLSGFGLVLASGSSQALDCYMVWDE